MQQDGQRLPVEENPEDVRATVFSFVSVRSSQRLLTPADTGGEPAGFVFYNPALINSSLYANLTAIKEDILPLLERANQMVDNNLEKPLDPRKNELTIAGSTTKYPALTSHLDLSGASLGNYALWAAALGAQVEPLPDEYVYVGLSLANTGANDVALGAPKDLVVPDGYVADSYTTRATYFYSTSGDPSVGILIGDTALWYHTRGSGGFFRGQEARGTLDPLVGVVPVTYLTEQSATINLTITLRCHRQAATLEKWQIKTYNAILAAYQTRKNAYDNALANLLAQQQNLGTIQGTNPALNRTIEQNELKKGCLNWLFYGQDYSVYGVSRTTPPPDVMPFVSADAATLAGSERAKFLEQCFEWPLMTYLFYPYFWAGKPEWRRLYQVTDTDPLFQQFLQAGLARVHVPVRPGYEKAAMHFLSTGQVWNGGEVPTIDSPVFLSIVDELRQPVGVRVGQPWELRVPSALTVLQAESGAVAGKGLPCDCDPGKALGGTGEPGKLTPQPTSV